MVSLALLNQRHAGFSGVFYTLSCGIASLYPCGYRMTLPAVVLYHPEIPPNAGNIIRLCANTGASLHMIHPLGFALRDRELRRAGLDYIESARIREHASLADFTAAVRPTRLFAFTTRGTCDHCEVDWRATDAMLFGPETAGLPAEVLAEVDPRRQIRLPMRAGSRSMNLANSVAVAVFEAWRQGGFAGRAEPDRD